MGNWSLNPAEWYRKAADGSELCALAGLVQLAALAPVLLAMYFDQRQLLGINVWIKPAKFLVSSWIFLWTLGWLLSLVEAAAVSKSWVGGISATMILFENVAICGQALRGERSHFNVTSALNGAVFGLMGVMIVINTIALVCLLYWFFATPKAMPAGALWGCRLGVLMAVLASVQGGYMSVYGAHTVGAADGGPGLPGLNWSTQAGDLRIAHFIGLHGMQVLPWAGFLLSEFGASAGVFLVALFYYTAFALTFLQAIAKKPLFF
jgi:hypothetical protein